MFKYKLWLKVVFLYDKTQFSKENKINREQNGKCSYSPVTLYLKPQLEKIFKLTKWYQQVK